MQQSPTNGTASGAVYVQTNAAPNEVIAFRRADDGSLDRIESMATGGDGDGSPHLQSQGSVTLTGDGQYLLVTNAASDDVSVFSVAADGSIELRERVHTGATPRSVAERDSLVVVLNTREPGLASFRLNAEGIVRVEGGDQRLDASHTDPAQVAFSPDGSMVVITERATDSIVTYEVAPDGTFGASSAVASEGPTPYGFAFTSGGTLIVTEAFGAEKGAAAASSYAIEDGSLVAHLLGWQRPQRDLPGCHHTRRPVRLHDELRRRRRLTLRDRLRRFFVAGGCDGRHLGRRNAGTARRGPLQRRAIPLRDRR
jgi:6-phosphogluconolactonase